MQIAILYETIHSLSCRVCKRSQNNPISNAFSLLFYGLVVNKLNTSMKNINSQNVFCLVHTGRNNGNFSKETWKENYWNVIGVFIVPLESLWNGNLWNFIQSSRLCHKSRLTESFPFLSFLNFHQNQCGRTKSQSIFIYLYLYSPCDLSYGSKNVKHFTLCISKDILSTWIIRMKL